MPNPIFPSYVKLGWNDSGEQHRPVVERAEMERGIPKHRRREADALVTVPLTLYFDTKQNAADFEDWFYSPTGANGGAGWFDFTLPRTSAVVQARIPGGDIGTLQPLKGNWERSRRQVKLEYVRVSL